jgi:hypothetical protein
MVGHRPLEASILVRIQARQPKTKRLEGRFVFGCVSRTKSELFSRKIRALISEKLRSGGAGRKRGRGKGNNPPRPRFHFRPLCGRAVAFKLCSFINFCYHCNRIRNLYIYYFDYSNILQ